MAVVNWEDLGTPLDSIGEPVQYMPEQDDGLFEVVSKSLVKGFTTLGKGVVGTAEELVELIPGVEETNYLTKVKGNIEEFEKGYEVTPSNAIEWGASIIGQALPYMGAALVGGLYGGAIGAGAVALAVEGQDAYDNAKKRGATETQANVERILVGSVNAAIESLQIGKIMKFGKEGKMTFKLFKKLVQDKAYDKLIKEGGKFSGKLLMNSIEEGFEEAAQQGVQILTPGFIEGREALPLRDDGSIDTGAILKEIGGAALAGAVVSPFLGVTKAFVPAMISPDIKSFDTLKSAIQNSNKSNEWKAAHIRDIDLQIEKITGEKPYSPKEDKELVLDFFQERFPKLLEIPDDIQFISKEEMIKRTGDSNLGFYNPVTNIVLIRNDQVIHELTNSLGHELTHSYRYARHPELAMSDQIQEFNMFQKAGHINREFFDEWMHRFRPQRKLPGEKQAYKIGELAAAKFMKWNEIDSYRKLLDTFDNMVIKAAEFRPVHNETISERRGAKKNEAAEFAKDNYPKVEAGIMTEEEFAVGMKTIMQGNLTPEFNIGMVREQYDTFLKAVRHTYSPHSFEYDMALSVYHKLFYGNVLPEKSEIEILEPILGKSIVNKFLGIIEKKRKSNLTIGQKIVDGFMEAVNFPRATLASWDVSFTGRQGFLMLFKDPKLWAKSYGVAWKSYLSSEYADFLDLNIRTNPMFDFVRDVLKVPFMEPYTAKTDERFVSQLARKVPGVRASERAYTAAANYLRYNFMYKMLEDWEGTGRTIQDKKDLAQVVKHITGYGDIKALEKYNKFLNIGFFAPRLYQATIQRVTDLNPIEFVKGRPSVRFSPAQKMLAGVWLKAALTGSSILYLLSLIKGVEVEKDPRSTDFGKIRIGDTRIDFFGDNTRMIRMITQLSLGKRKTGSGDFMEAERIDIITKFLQTKLSPGAGLVVDMYSGQDFTGKILNPDVETVSEQIIARSAPLFLQDLYDMVASRGLDGVTAMGSVAAFNGVGVLTYPESQSSQARTYKNEKAKEYFDAKWDDLGPISQKILRLYEPLIDQLDALAHQERSIKQVNTRFLKEMRKSERVLFNSFSSDMKEQLNKLLVDVGGMSRRVGSDWYLNDQRYAEYQLEVSKELKEILPVYLKLRLDPQVKKMLVEDVITDVKEKIRRGIILEANIKDLRTGSLFTK